MSEAVAHRDAVPHNGRAHAARWSDYLELTKPRIGLMVMVTVAVGAAAAGGGHVSLATLMPVVVGTAILGGGASALNHWLEREADKRMRRTAQRPVPTGRVSSSDACWFGAGLSAVGIIILAMWSTPLAALLGCASLVCYVAIYTPLKRATAWNTVVGAIPGALPILIGWAGVNVT